MPRSHPGSSPPDKNNRPKPHGLFVVGPDLTVVATDARLPFSLGMRPALMRGRRAVDLFGPDVEAALARVLADGRPIHCALDGEGGEATLALADVECSPQAAAESADVVGILARGLPWKPDDSAQGMPVVEELQELCSQLLEGLSADPTPMLDAVLERACSYGPYDLAMVWLLDDGGILLRPAAWLGYSDRDTVDALSLKVLRATGGRRLRRVVAEGVPSVVEDVLNADGMCEFKLEGVKSAAFVPVRSRARTLGVLHVGSRTPHRFYPGELRVLEILGSLAGVAVQKARLYRDATEAGRERDESRKELARAFTVMRSIPDIVATLDADARIEFLNDAGRQLVGACPEDDPASVPLARLMGSAAKRRWQEEMLPAALHSRTWSGEVELIGPGGRRTPFSVILARHSRPDGSPYFSFIARDIRHLKMLERKLEGLASRDALTGVLNRRGFHAALKKRLMRGKGGAAAGTLLFIDLDDFKEINDTLGHEAGDALLEAVARRLRQSLPRDVILARLGGDEFAALLRCDEANACNVARDLLSGLHAAPFELPGGRWSGITASIGIACFTGDAADAGALLSQADIAMYQAKGRGRDTFALYSAITGRRWKRSVAALMSWEERIKHALQTDGFALHAQPITDLRSGRTVYYELLIRMQDGDGELIPPDRFLGAAERFGLIGAIDGWGIRQAAHLLAAADPETCVGLNLSVKSLFDPAEVQRTMAMLATSGVAPRRLVFEITETTRIAHLGDVRRSIAALREAGYRIALDDFGIGFASLDLLKTLPLDFLKIDRRFVQNLRHEPADRPIVEGLVHISRGLGLRTIAEGIEDGETMDVLQGLGVDCGQGFYLAQPAPASNVMNSGADPRVLRAVSFSGSGLHPSGR